MSDRTATAWGPRPLAVAAAGVAGATLLTCAGALQADPPGRVLAGLAGLGLLVFAAASWWARPKLAVTADGLAVHGLLRTRVLPPEQIARIRITEFRRWGRRMRLLEIETRDDRLVVLSRWDLGVDPLDVLDALTAAGYAGR